MHLLHVSPSYHPFVGGAETHLRQISERLAQRGHHVSVFTLREVRETSQRRNEYLPKCQVLNGVNLRRFDSCDRLGNFIRRACKLPGGHRVLRSVLGTDALRFVAEDPLHPRLLLNTICSGAEITMIVNWSN